MFGHSCSDFASSASLRAVIHSLATHGGARLRLFKHLGAQVFGGEIGLILPRDGVQNGRQVKPLELRHVAQGREYRAPQGIRQVDDAPLARTEAQLEFVRFDVLGLYTSNIVTHSSGAIFFKASWAAPQATRRLRLGSAVGDGRSNVLRRELWILLEKFPHGHASGKKIKDQRDPNAGAADGWLPETNPRIHRNTFEQWMRFHDAPSEQL